MLAKRIARKIRVLMCFIEGCIDKLDRVDWEVICNTAEQTKEGF